MARKPVVQVVEGASDAAASEVLVMPDAPVAEEAVPASQIAVLGEPPVLPKGPLASTETQAKIWFRIGDCPWNSVRAAGYSFAVGVAEAFSRDDPRLPELRANPYLVEIAPPAET